LKKSVLYVLIALLLVIGAAAVACGGGDNGDGENKEPTAAEEQNGQDQQDTPAAEATQEEATPESGGDGGSGGSLGDVPVYPGANKITGGEWSGSEGMIPGIGSELDTADYQNIEFAMYETSDSPDDVFNWYKDKMSGWDEQGSFSGGSGSDYGAYALWTKDGGKTAAWVTIGTSDGTTELGLWVATQ
jgi:hypothetical protein